MTTSDVGLDLADHAQLIAGILERLVGRFDDPTLHKRIQPDEALELHQTTKVLAGLLRDLASETDRLLIVSLDGQRKAVVGDKLVEVRRAYRRFDWDHPLLAERVAIAALEGEVLPETKTIVDAWLKACRPEWRTTALKDMGIDADAYCSKELGRATVTVA